MFRILFLALIMLVPSLTFAISPKDITEWMKVDDNVARVTGKSVYLGLPIQKSPDNKPTVMTKTTTDDGRLNFDIHRVLQFDCENRTVQTKKTILTEVNSDSLGPIYSVVNDKNGFTKIREGTAAFSIASMLCDNE